MLNLTQRIIGVGMAHQELSAEFRRQLEAKEPVLIEALGGPNKVAYIEVYCHSTSHVSVVYRLWGDAPYAHGNARLEDQAGDAYCTEYIYNVPENEWQRNTEGRAWRMELSEEQEFLKEMLNILNSKG